MDQASRLRIIVLGYIVRGPMGGMAWHHLQYVLGLKALGHDVFFIEDSDDYPSCYDPTRGVVDTDPTYGLKFAAQAFDRVGLGERWAYYDAHTDRWFGPRADDIVERCSNADLLLNVSGVNPLRPWLMQIPARAFLDTDPVFTQVRHLTHPGAHALAQQHTAFLSFGENIGQPDCTVPEDGFAWQSTRQPIVMEAWPLSPGPPEGKFTTVMQWDSYPAQEYAGQEYGMKSRSFGPFLNLPTQVGPIFELAIGSAAAPREQLRAQGWTVCDPQPLTHDPFAYQRYLQQSKAEFSVAKHGYVVSRSGWFSERSAAYLASGRPVITQETGFDRWLPDGCGVHAFQTLSEAVAAIRRVNADYQRHCTWAREIAHAYFDSNIVLTALIEKAMCLREGSSLS